MAVRDDLVLARSMVRREAFNTYSTLGIDPVRAAACGDAGRLGALVGALKRANPDNSALVCRTYEQMVELLDRAIEATR